MDQQRIHQLLAIYRDGLLHDTIPFWMSHGLDDVHGGYFTALDRDGRLLDSDKSVWFQGRFAWILARLCHELGPREDWLAACRSGIDFLRSFCFDTDGRMFFQVTREGQPLRKRQRYVASERFATMALAEYARVAGDQQAADEATHLFQATDRALTTPGVLIPKINPETRPQRDFGTPMIAINVAQVLRDALDDSSYTEYIDRCIADIRRLFLNESHRAVLEVADPDGELIDHFDGRTLNPGHAIEGAWFILWEAKQRGGDQTLIELGTQMLDWMWEWGWDKEFGGILYFRDIKGSPVQEYWHDMKFWWPQNEAIIATLLAYLLTGDEKYARWHTKIHDWAYRFFPDVDYGEWYGYLHRDGRVSHRAKGTMWKGPFHLPRMQLTCWKLLESVVEG